MKCLLNILLLICLCLNLNAKEIPYHFNNTFKITVSDKLELRKDGDFYNKLLSDNGFEVNTKSAVVFQQKGLSDIVQKSFNTYCRILIQVIDCEDEECYSADCSDFSTEDYDFFRQAAYDNLAPTQKMVKNPSINVLRQNGYNYVKVSYTRTGKYGNVEVAMYYLFNLKKAVMMTTSYNIPDANIWKNVVENAFKSFRWDKIYKEETTAYYNETPTYSNNSNDYYSGNYYDNTTNYSQPKKDKSGVVGLLVIMLIVAIIITVAVVNSTSKNDQQTYNKPVAQTNYNPQPPAYNPPAVQKALEKTAIDLEKYNAPLIRVNYSIKGEFDTTCYPIVKVPEKGTVVFPHRNNKAQRRGFTEETFELKLKKSMPDGCNYVVSGGVSILPPHYERPYEPDIAIIEKSNKYGIRIDIEIDEPYSAIDRKPIHFIDCGDDYRDKVFNCLGWLVMRFSEKQIHLESDKCISYIQRILSVIDDSFRRNVPIDEPTHEKRWTETEAKIMMVEKFREKLLKHDFGVIENEPVVAKKIRQTEAEKAAQQFVKPVEIPKGIDKNIDGSTTAFAQDAELFFEPKEHIYRYGNRILKPVSNVVAEFFEGFDSLGMSERKSGGNISEQIKLIETWESKGAKAREVGTQMHLAIENYFQNRPMPDSYHFKFSGRYIKKDEDISIKTEIGYFKNFLKDNPNLNPFRTEWRICDLKYGIAGSIDFICRSGDGFDMYDWKRSKKSSPDETIWRYGLNGLEHIPDISYWHYALQQNLYRYILRENYGVTLNKMHIVVLHPEFSNYRVYKIPVMDKEIKTMLNNLK